MLLLSVILSCPPARGKYRNVKENIVCTYTEALNYRLFQRIHTNKITAYSRVKAAHAPTTTPTRDPDPIT